MDQRAVSGGGSPSTSARARRRRGGLPLLAAVAVAAVVGLAVVPGTAMSGLLPGGDPLAGAEPLSAVGWVGVVPAGWSAVVVEEDVDPNTSTVCLSVDGSCRIVLRRIPVDPWNAHGSAAEAAGRRSFECTGRPTTARTLAPSGRRAYLVTSPCTLAGSPAELLELVVPEYGLTAAAFRSPNDVRTGELVTAVLDRLDVDPSTPSVELEERTCDELPDLCPGHPRKPTPLPTS